MDERIQAEFTNISIRTFVFPDYVVLSIVGDSF
nr:MAG TPA: hypothetical protein [Caudoviricetes sp.]